MSGNNIETTLAESELHDIGPPSLVERWTTVSNKHWPNVLLQPISNGHNDIEPTFDQCRCFGWGETRRQCNLAIAASNTRCNEALLMSFAHGLPQEFRFPNGLYSIRIK